MHTDFITFDQALYDTRIAMRDQSPRQQLSEVEAGWLKWHFVWPCAGQTRVRHHDAGASCVGDGLAGSGWTRWCCDKLHLDWFVAWRLL